MPAPNGTSKPQLSEEGEQLFRVIRSIRHDMQSQNRNFQTILTNHSKEAADKMSQDLLEVQGVLKNLPESVAASTSKAVEACLLEHSFSLGRQVGTVTASLDNPAAVGVFAACRRPEDPRDIQVPGEVPNLLVPGQIPDSSSDDEHYATVPGDASESDQERGVDKEERSTRQSDSQLLNAAFSRTTVKTQRSKFLDEQLNDAAEQQSRGKSLKKIITRLKRAQSLSAPPVEAILPPRRVARRIVSHPRFEVVVSVIMLLCGLQIGAEADHVMVTGELDNKYFEAIGLTFNILFTVELILRLSSDGWFYFSLHNASIGWNVLDFVLVFVSWVSQLLEQFTALSGGNQESNGMSVELLRMLRLLRIVKVMRIIRVVRFFSELRVMINGILGSSKSLLWALLLLMLIIYLFGVTLMQIVTSLKGPRSTLDPILAQCFGSMGSTMMTLYKAISGGFDWNDCASPLYEIHPVLELIFSAYVFLTLFCVLNIITGIFVDNAKALKQMDEDAMFQESLAARRRWVADIASVFNAVDDAGMGNFTFEVFTTKLQDIRVQTLFRNLGINLDVTTPEELWELFDIDDSGAIDADEFAYGVKQFNGFARSIDLYKSRKDVRALQKRMELVLKTATDTATRRKSKGK
eukprot:TRINITY_DN255_c0_g2_i1.p1 TRINITY_DN255_c0_g2~~TRINITY_DN255_c0_g2_i1.p1  ORF type:complete len:635 (+),score=102.34 TRINITY_DN255_c0_g2_i1:108-2012(+)